MSQPLHIAILTVSDSRTAENDSSGALLKSLVEQQHSVAAQTIVNDDIYRIRAVVSQWIADENIQVIICTGGTGLTGRDSTPEALEVLFDKRMDGFGEVFRMQSYNSIGSSTIQSRACAGLANATVIFSLPGSKGACKDGWNIIKDQLDSDYLPCNLVALMPRFKET